MSTNATVRAVPRFNTLTFQRPRIFPLLGFVAVLLVVSLFFVWSRLQVIHLEYAISSAESRIREAQEELRRLKLEAASLRNPARIERLAVHDLGLRFPVPAQVVTIK